MLTLLAACSAEASTAVIQSGTHADTFIAPAINAALGPGHVDTDIFVDTTGSIGSSYTTLSGQMLNTMAGYQSVASGATVNHAPYPVAGLSACGWSPANELIVYSEFQSNAQVFAWAYGEIACGDDHPSSSAPGVVVATASAPNSSNGGSGPGIEFGFSANYLGLNTSEDSWITAELAGFLIALEFQHPTWNPFDIKAALRITAGNWTTGYSATHFGYGSINYSAATALSTPSTFYLQPPGVVVQNNGYYAIVTLMPFRQVRRDHELIYSVSASYVWPVKNEYTATDIAASGATLLYTGNSTDATPQYTFVPAASGTATLIAFTTDGSGHFSRAESFSDIPVTLTIGTMCTQ